MRSPHRHAEADDRRGASRPWVLGVPILLALSAGCVIQQAPRTVSGEEVLGALARLRPSSASGAADSVVRPTGPTESASRAADRRATPNEPGHRVVIASARAGSTSGYSGGQGTADPQVKRAADREPVPAPTVTPPPSGEYPIDLPTSLRLADQVNPTINRARSVVLEALAQQLTARTLLVPSLNAGGNYHGHNGVLQRSSGKILNLSEQSLYVGAGAFTVAAETVRIPGVSILTPLTDAFFEPLVARQRVIASRFNVKATENDILGEVAVLHLELIRHYTLLETSRLSEVQAYQIVQAIEGFAITGQGRKSDYDRARAEWRYRRADVIDAEQGIGVAAARLAQRLNLDPSVRLNPAGGPIVPLDLVSLDGPPEELIQVALRQRPDLAARTAEIGQAEARVKEEIGRPLLPTLWLGFSGGMFGGGSNLVPPLVGKFAGRTDFDVRLYWTLFNMGLGNVAQIRERQAEVGQAVALRARTINRARDEVMEALAEAKAARNQIGIARQELKSAHEGFHEDLERSRQNLGRPIEVINSLNLLARARAHLIDAIVRYDQAQFRLWVALGTPPPLVGTSTPDQPPIPDYLQP
jgi:outer membrane protein TolC